MTDITAAPRAVFGMTLYNNARHLPEAIESLLAQSDSDFGLLLLDDGSSDGSGEIAGRYAARDGRLRYTRHPERQGMVAAWRDAFDCATAAWPDAEYFAWASDHDRWDSAWLATLRPELDAHPEVVLAYGLTRRIDAEGALLEKPPRVFETAGMADPVARTLKVASEAAGAGDMVYGLMRAAALRNAGVFRPVIQPDRLLIAELALFGEFRQVPQVLWYRRHAAEASVVRQRHTLFTPATVPADIDAAHWRQHARVLKREYVRTPRQGFEPAAMRRMVLEYQLWSVIRHYSKSDAILHRVRLAIEAVHNGWKFLKHVWRHVVYEAATRPRVMAQLTRKQAERAGRRIDYWIVVARRRTRAAGYETGAWLGRQSGRVRRFTRKAVYHVLMLRHRLGVGGGHGTGPVR